jgi:dodecin
MVEKTVLLTGSSPNGIQEAIELAVARAAVTIEGLRRARIRDVRMELEGAGITRWTVDVDISFEVREDVHD